MRGIDVIVIGCSLGGMRALQTVLEPIPATFAAPIVVVQHRHRASAEGLPAFIRKSTALKVVDADDKVWIKPGHVYLAPADYHLLVEKVNGNGELSLSVDDRVSYARPSIDVLFESAADAYADRVVGVVLTGANADGAEGAKRIKRRGGFVVVQDPKTAEAPAMPQAVIDAVRVDRILPLERIGPYLLELCRATGC
jgi:two-component system chemotaxis response regulator CheB